MAALAQLMRVRLPLPRIAPLHVTYSGARP
jgi:hypothetical protein